MSIYLRKIPEDIAYKIPYKDSSMHNILLKLDGDSISIENNSKQYFNIPECHIELFLDSIRDLHEIIKEKIKNETKDNSSIL